MKTHLNLGPLLSPSVFQSAAPQISQVRLYKGQSTVIVGNKASCGKQQKWDEVGQWIWLVLVWYIVICSKSVCSSRPCAPRAFPWECSLLFRTPGIASGVLLVRLMWAKQRGNKEYGNLQIIAELKTSGSLTQAQKTLSLALKQADTQVCVHIMPVLRTWTWCI